MLQKSQKPSQSIRHPKLHGFRYQECPNCTFLRDFRPFQNSDQKSREAQKSGCKKFDFNHQLSYFWVLLDAQTTFQTIRHEKYIILSILCVLRMKILPYLASVAQRPYIIRKCIDLDILGAQNDVFFMPDCLELCFST